MSGDRKKNDNLFLFSVLLCHLHSLLLLLLLMANKQHLRKDSHPQPSPHPRPVWGGRRVLLSNSTSLLGNFWTWPNHIKSLKPNFFFHNKTLVPSSPCTPRETSDPGREKVVLPWSVLMTTSLLTLHPSLEYLLILLSVSKHLVMLQEIVSPPCEGSVQTTKRTRSVRDH